MPPSWAYAINERSGLALPGRTACEGRRWRPWEPSNDCPKPKDLAAYLASFQARPPAAKGTR